MGTGAVGCSEEGRSGSGLAQLGSQCFTSACCEFDGESAAPAPDCRISIGRGKMMVEFFSAEIAHSVCR